AYAIGHLRPIRIGNLQQFMLAVYFFQAEDGIRDKLVTGVQTCALPIWRSRFLRLLHQLPDRPEARRHRRRGGDHGGSPSRGDGRSEERRVGKVWIAGVGGSVKKKKKKVAGEIATANEDEIGRDQYRQSM